MKIDISINEKNEDLITIKASKITDELKEIIDSINKILNNKKIYGKKNDKTYLIDFNKLNNIIVENKKTIAYLLDKTDLYLDYKLYELENILDLRFVRISKSEIINIEMINYLSFEKNGMTKIQFKNGNYSYTSRMYLKNLKERLKL